jgi:hypothetical protein
MLKYGIFSHAGEIKPVMNHISTGPNDLTAIGGMGILLLFLRAYSLGGGTYTGIEAVSNGLQIMREPRESVPASAPWHTWPWIHGCRTGLVRFQSG